MYIKLSYHVIKLIFQDFLLIWIFFLSFKSKNGNFSERMQIITNTQH